MKTRAWLLENLPHQGKMNLLDAVVSWDADQIQCIVSKDLIPNSVAFGQTQQPKLWDYADNVDTLAFLNSLK